MQLSDYLKEQKLTLTAFAKAIGTPHARTVERYAKRKSIPNKEMMRRVTEATAGAVTANDFFAPSEV
ncbi:MAG: hypothetical protein JWO65_1921 [Sphingomonas bacterium]|nr:hypothetical protein [Sphingomonas bacterium]